MTQPPTAHDARLSIGDLADQTGVSPATLRMWEQRHGFPVPQRLESGHRRYLETDVDAVRRVLEGRDAGTRLDVAIEQAVRAVQAEAEPRTPSVWAELRRRHPYLDAHRLTKSTLLALSWAIEDEFAARADRAHLFGLFQVQRNFERAEHRWDELARVAASTYVFADFDDVPDLSTSSIRRPVRVPLAIDAPMRREWAVVVDSVDLPIALTAWELPGQEDVPNREKIFESAWTVEPAAVRDAARVCARVAADAGAPGAPATLYHLADEPGPGMADLRSVTTLFNRVVAYVDRAPRSHA